MDVRQTRRRMLLYIALVVALSWLAMQAVHELGHVLHALVSGGSLERVVLRPLAISRTDVSPNPHPQFVAWGGVVWGTIVPLGLFVIARRSARGWVHLAGFFAGFCCVANGLYLAAGSFSKVGDAGELLRHGAARWELFLFGFPVTAIGLWLWHGLGPRLGFGESIHRPDARVLYGLALVLAIVSRWS